MTEIEWTDAEREAVTGALTVEPVGDVVMVVNRDGTQAMGASLTIDAPGFAQVVLAALAPHVAAREAQARAGGATQALNDALRDCPLDDVVQILDFLEARYQEVARIERGES